MQRYLKAGTLIFATNAQIFEALTSRLLTSIILNIYKTKKARPVRLC